MLSPLVMAARADQVIAAEKLLTIIVACGAVFLWLAFDQLERASSPTLFLVLIGINAFITAPAWSLLTTITLTNVQDPARDFGKYRVWGTVGWMAAGWLVSVMAMDVSPAVGKLGVYTRVLGAMCCFMLPHTPPKGGPAKTWAEALGLGALRILKERDMAVFFATSFFFAIPLAAFYLHTPRNLRVLGWDQVAAGMTIGQVSEVIAMLLMGWVLRAWRIKWLFAFALSCGIVRYTLYALGSSAGSPICILLGVAFHGVCWTYFFEAGRVFIEKRVNKGVRAQAQALQTLLTGGLGNLVGAMTVAWLYNLLVDPETGAGWSSFWWVLTGMCVVCLTGFLIGYRGRAKL